VDAVADVTAIKGKLNDEPLVVSIGVDRPQSSLRQTLLTHWLTILSSLIDLSKGPPNVHLLRLSAHQLESYRMPRW